jgi:pimeloyl-ACP methyl ester carboxylesterase
MLMVKPYYLVMPLVCLAMSMTVEAAAPQSMDLETATKPVTVRGLTFPVVDHGSGPVVLLLHGFPDDRHLWRYQVGPLVRAGFRVVAPDLRGFGDAPRPQDPKDYGLSIVIDDILGILDALEIRQVQLVAHDWGAAVGWRMAALHPERVSRYVALSVGAPGGRPTIEQREKSWYMAFFRQTGTAEKQLRGTVPDQAAPHTRTRASHPAPALTSSPRTRAFCRCASSSP